MAKKKSEGSRKKPTMTKEFIKIDDLGDEIKKRFDAYRLSPQFLDFSLRVAGGEAPYDVVEDIYSLTERKDIKRQATNLLLNPKIQFTIEQFRANLEFKSLIDANTVIARLELLYAEASYDGDKRMMLEILKEQSRLVQGFKENNPANITINFQLPDVPKPIIDITDIQDE